MHLHTTLITTLITYRTTTYYTTPHKTTPHYITAYVRTVMLFYHSGFTIYIHTYLLYCTVLKNNHFRISVSAGPTERRQALQVYSYHSDENTFQTVYTFIKGLGFQFSPLKSPINEAAIFKNIQKIKSGYVAFSTDVKVLDDEPTLQSQLAEFFPYFQHVIGK